jgi:uncharacterized protein (TIGR02466 family)
MNPIFLFPTVLGQFQLNDKVKLQEIIDSVKTFAKKKTRNKDAILWQSEGAVQHQEEFKWLTDCIVRHGEEYMKFMGYEFNTIQVESMWINTYEENDNLHIHNHPNSFISGVFYLTDGADIQFLDPRGDIRSIILPNKVHNFHNAFSFDISPSPGKLILFPSWLKHSVYRQHSGWRASIAFNMMVRGSVGSNTDLTNMTY